MPKYRVDLGQTVYEVATVYVEAANSAAAEALAERRATTGELECNWRFVDTEGPIEAMSCYEVEE